MRKLTRSNRRTTLANHARPYRYASLLSMALSATLVLSGCGGDSGSDNKTEKAAQPPADPPKTPAAVVDNDFVSLSAANVAAGEAAFKQNCQGCHELKPIAANNPGAILYAVDRLGMPSSTIATLDQNDLRNISAYIATKAPTGALPTTIKKSTTLPLDYSSCAGSDGKGICYFSGVQEIFYGSDGNYRSLYVNGPRFDCQSAPEIFGAIASTGKVKQCFGLRSAVSSTPPVEFQPSAITHATKLKSPWSFALLPDGRILVTQRDASDAQGRLVLVSADGKVVTPLTGLSSLNVFTDGQGGMLDVVLDPNFATNNLFYVSFAEKGTGADANKAGTAVAQLRLSGNTLSLQKILFRQAPKVATNIDNSAYHFGSRLAISADKKLFISLGDRYLESAKAQTLDNHLGKIVRINLDGTVPADNPFVGKAGAMPEIWSFGHRNPQGLAIHPVTGELWASEHGPQGGDEINRIVKGKNYGWPSISYGCQYGEPVGDCATIGGKTADANMEQPLTYWVPFSIAPSGLAFYTSNAIPQWQNSLFSGALAGKAIWRMTVDNQRVLGREQLYAGMQKRVRAIRVANDGSVFFIQEDSPTGSILKIAPPVR